MTTFSHLITILSALAAASAIPTQPPCKHPVDCLGMPCVYHPFCNGYPDAVCVPDSCGCSPKYYVGDTEVQCIQSGMFGKREESSNFKPGFTIKYQCPPVHPTHLGICMSTCEQDSDCDASKNEKCCFNGGCGKTCRAGVIPPKTGSCPTTRFNLRGPCVMSCAEHPHCEGNKLCCSNGCGMECKAPVWD